MLRGRPAHSRKRPAAAAAAAAAGSVRFVLIGLCVQCFWFLYDHHVTSQIKYKIPRKYAPPTESGPLSPFYLEPYTGPAHAFAKWPRTFPCGPLVGGDKLMDRSLTKEGFIFINQRQTGSTTLSGIAFRITRNVARRQNEPLLQAQNNQTSCTVRIPAVKAKRWKDRSVKQSFMWTMLREPVERTVSKFYHIAVSRHGQEPSLKNFQNYVDGNELNDYASYFKSLSMRKMFNSHRTDFHEMFVEEILRDFDFLGILERMDESLAVLQLILGLETEDLLYLPAKTRGSYEKYYEGCIKIKTPEIPMQMKEWLYLPELDDYFDADIMMYRAANASLDLTIAELGKDRVEKAVRRLEWAQRHAQEQCASKAKFPCSADGVVNEQTDCFFGDIGCGYQCLDEAGNKLVDNPEFQNLAR